MLITADYVGGSAASFKINDGRLSKAVWTETYTFHGPNTDRQKTAHAHFASFSPDNRFAYINDLGGDCIHIYKPNLETAAMTPAGTYKGAPGSGPRTLHFHPNGHTAYCMNELDSTVDVLEWQKADGSLSLTKRIELLPEGYKGPTRGCDTVDALFTSPIATTIFCTRSRPTLGPGALRRWGGRTAGAKHRGTLCWIRRSGGCWWRTRIRI
jgi:6-phosphogluconolactonase